MRRLLVALLFLPAAAFADTKIVNMIATANPWQFVPSQFTVNEGDLVTLNITVPAADPSPAGHGFVMNTFAESGFLIPKGQTKSITFTATPAGEYAFACFQPSCGTGHGSMFGKMVVTGTVVTTPAISSVSPDTGPTSGGTQVVISGSNFSAPASVTIGSFHGTNVTVIDANTIDFLTPPGPFTGQAGSPLDVTVTTPGGTATKAGAFHYFVPPLAISAVRPSLGLAGATVSITGAGFLSSLPLTVTFDGINATASVVDAITIQATVPAHANGAVDVVVRLGANTVTLTRGFTYGLGRRRTVHH